MLFWPAALAALLTRRRVWRPTAESGQTTSWKSNAFELASIGVDDEAEAFLVVCRSRN